MKLEHGWCSCNNQRFRRTATEHWYNPRTIASLQDWSVVKGVSVCALYNIICLR